MADRILIVVHQEHSTPGRVGNLLRQRGYDLDIRRTCMGHPLPETMEDHAGVVIFGGPMSANDCQSLDFIGRELKWIDVALREDAPFLGICLGAQLLTRALGGSVTKHDDKLFEVGYYGLEATPAGREIGDWPDHVYQWHSEGFSVPDGAVLTARGTGHFPNQAFRYGQSAHAIQFHPEVTLAMMHRWTVRAAHRFDEPGVRPRHSHFEERFIYDPAVAGWLGAFLDRWLASDRRSRPMRLAAQ